ncbi:MAG: hypothetical protein JW704_03390, partial [Anaerolineaceae bacterium]|nr:hypothetical protein [Anaerolineaceae bacterium]
RKHTIPPLEIWQAQNPLIPPVQFLGSSSQLYGRHFQDVDEKKMQIVVYLYRQLRSCYGDIVNKTIATIGLNPTIFISVLEREPDWESIVEGLSLEWESFLPILGRLGDTEFAQEVKNQAFRAHEGRDQKIEIIAAFLNDPVMLFDKVRTWDDIGFWIGQYGDRLYTEGRLTEPIIDVFIRTHFQEIDEKKIEILMHLLLRSGGFIGEMLSDETAKIFMLHPSVFIKVLERTEDWQRVVDKISMLSWNNFHNGLMRLGDTEFEKSLRKYINDKRIV